MSWGIVGWGWIARDHIAPVLGDRLLAVCDAGDDLGAFLRTPGLRRVHVATPNHLHEAQVAAIAAAGCDVLCEKPTALTLAAARRMAAACAEAGVRFATAYNQRFHPAHVALRALVAEGALGTVTQARVHYACSLPPWWGPGDWHFDPGRAGGGAVFDLAPHGIDLVGVLLGALPADVVALHQRRVHREHPVEDGGAIAVRYDDDALATVSVAYSCPETFPRRTLELIGTAGMAIARDTMGQTPGGTVELVDARDGTWSAVPFDPGGDPFRAQADAFEADWPHTVERDLAVMAAVERAAAPQAVAA